MLGRRSDVVRRDQSAGAKTLEVESPCIAHCGQRIRDPIRMPQCVAGQTKVTRTSRQSCISISHLGCKTPKFANGICRCQASPLLWNVNALQATTAVMGQNPHHPVFQFLCLCCLHCRQRIHQRRRSCKATTGREFCLTLSVFIRSSLSIHESHKATIDFLAWRGGVERCDWTVGILMTQLFFICMDGAWMSFENSAKLNWHKVG